MKKLCYSTLNAVLILSLVIAPVQRVSACAEAGGVMDDLYRTQTINRNGRNHNVSKQRKMDCESTKAMSMADDQVLSLDQSDVKIHEDHCNCKCSNCHTGHVTSTAILDVSIFLAVNLPHNQFVILPEDSNLKVTLPVEIQPPIYFAV